MDQLASCYFCGGALDVSLSEYPVVPKDLQGDGDERETVVLCGTCRKKLAKIVENVVAATAVESGDGRSFEGTGFTANEPSETTTEEPLFDAKGDEPGPDDRGETAGQSVPAAGDEAEPGAGDDAAESEPATTVTEATSDAESTDTGAVEEKRDESEQSDGTADDGGTDEDDDGPSLSRLEYNKVMRLLKNREFPVDKMEIRDVATSAYQIRPDEFDAVIEAAIERDLLAEEDGQFVDPN